MVWQPDVVTEIVSELLYDADSFVAPQPQVEMEISVELIYAPPPSTGGQPLVVTTITLETSVSEFTTTSDTVGTSELVFTSNAIPEVDAAIVPVPPDVIYSPVQIVSINYSGSP